MPTGLPPTEASPGRSPSASPKRRAKPYNLVDSLLLKEARTGATFITEPRVARTAFDRKFVVERTGGGAPPGDSLPRGPTRRVGSRCRAIGGGVGGPVRSGCPNRDESPQDGCGNLGKKGTKIAKCRGRTRAPGRYASCPAPRAAGVCVRAEAYDAGGGGGWGAQPGAGEPGPNARSTGWRK